MALPYVFASVASLVTSQLDSNFNALGALTPIPCTVTGTNALVLTPNANTPAQTAYVDYGQFSGVAAATNTGALTASVAGIGSLNVYKDSPAGPIQCVGGEVVINCAFTLMYDGALNSGAGGFHLFTTTAITGATISPSLVAAAVGSLVTGHFGLFNVGTATVTGSNVTRLLSGTFSVASITITAASSTDTTATLTGVVPGDTVMVGWPSTLNTGVVMFGFCPASGTLVLRAQNPAATTVTVTGNIFRLTAVGNT
jgi:hypothetical protein